VKKAAAGANGELGVLDSKRAEAIVAACDEIIAGKLHGRFTVDMIKMGRTENQDAVPMTLGQELGAYAVMIGDGIRHLEQTSTELLKVTFARSQPVATRFSMEPACYHQACCRGKLALFAT
jgi:aspartate ammonia-lyase